MTLQSHIGLSRHIKINKKSSDLQHLAPGGFFKNFCTCMCLPDFENVTHLYTCFWLKNPPISIPILTEKHPIVLELGAFWTNFLKYTQFSQIGRVHLRRKPPHRYTKICEKPPQKAGTYTYTMSMWVPPRAFGSNKITKPRVVYPIPAMLQKNID